MINNRQILKLLKTALIVRLVLLLLSGNALLFETAHAQVFLPQEVVVAVIDEGVDFSHPALQNKLWVNLKEVPNNNIDDDNNGYVDDISGWNFLDRNNDLAIKGSHGTKLAGIIAADKTSPVGFWGVNPKAKIMPLIVCKQNYGCDQSAIIQAIYYAIDNGAKVINLSLGDTSGYKKDYDAAILYAYQKNVVIVAASGSSVQGHSLAKEPMSPICNDNGKNMVLGVGTVDEKGTRPMWANYGGCIDVSALGTKVSATVPKEYSEELYEKVDGNSYSTALVSGAASLLLLNEPALTPSEVIARIHDNATGKETVLSVDRAVKNLALAEKPPKPKVKGIKIAVNSKIITQNKTPKLVIR